MSLVEQLMAGGGVILLVLALRFAAKPGQNRLWWQAGLRPRTRNLETVEQLRLTPQHSIHVVRFRDRVFVLAAHSGGCTVLEQRSWPGEYLAESRES
ncbi:MAG: flagellar biosynthetic protein FliO [Bryobacteraceae bacterium]